MRPTAQALTIFFIATAVLYATCPLTPGLLAATPSSRNSRTRLQQRQTSLRREILAKRTAIRSVRSRARQTKQQLETVEQRVRVARGMLQSTSRQLELKRIELSRATHNLQQAQRSFSQGREAAEDRLVAVYQRGEPGYLDLMLASNDFGEVLHRAQLAQYLMAQDRATLHDLRERKVRLEAYQQRVEEKKREVATLQQRAAVMHENYNRQRLHTAHTLTQTRAQMDAMEAELAALERDSAAVTTMLRRLARSQSGRARTSRYSGSIGGLPVQGHLTSHFGYRTHPILRTRRLHTGVDIGAPSGSSIHAAGAGEVIFAGWSGGYGNTVMIDHGRGKVTLYAHMSRIGARVGQVVARGTVVGAVGSTGLSTGPHLHYEVRINGAPVNPL